MEDQDYLDIVKSSKHDSKEVRDKIKPIVDECIKQYRCKHPDTWTKKEKWQTKVFVPIQYKNVQVARSHIVKMVLGLRRFFSIQGREIRDEEFESSLIELVLYYLDKMKFRQKASMIIEDSMVTGTNWAKYVPVPVYKTTEKKATDKLEIPAGKGKKKKIIEKVFTKRTKKMTDIEIKMFMRDFYDVYPDPRMTTDFTPRFLIDEVERDISYIVDMSRNSGDPYYLGRQNGSISRLIAEAAVKYNTDSKDDKIEVDIEGVLDGSQTISFRQPVVLEEYTGYVKQKDGTAKFMILVRANEKYLIRREKLEDENFSLVPCRTLPVARRFYGRGYIDTTRDLQKLANSIICLWGDNLKLAMMMIAAVDPRDVTVDWKTLVFKPGAKWKVKPESVKFFEQKNVVGDGIAIIGLIDQIVQETTGITRYVQGSATTTRQTRGEVEIKTQRADVRFLDVARWIESEFITESIKEITRLIIKYVPQKKVTEILGYKRLWAPIPFLPGIKFPVRKRRLDISGLRASLKNGDLDLDFTFHGLTQYTARLEQNEKLMALLEMAAGNPLMIENLHIDRVIKKYLQTLDIPDIDELIKTEAEREEQPTETPAPPEGAPPPVPGAVEGEVI